MTTAVDTSAQEQPHAVFTLMCDHSSITPGSTLTLGLRFKMEPGWHIYWNGLNDTGMAPKWTLEMPEGWKAQDALWPTPKRHISEGGILDHVYEGEVMILVPVHVPESSPAGEKSIAVQADWLVCKEACVFESGEGSSRVRVVSHGATVANHEAFTHARSRVPAELDERANVRVGYEKGVLNIEAPGASELRFFPSRERPKLSDPLRECETRGSALRLTLQETKVDEILSGVIEVVRSGEALAYTLRYDLNARGFVAVDSESSGAVRK